MGALDRARGGEGERDERKREGERKKEGDRERDKGGGEVFFEGWGGD